MSVIDAALRFPHLAAVIDHDEILAELRAQVDAKRFTQRAVAKALNISPPRVKEMLNGNRNIQPKEMRPLVEFLGIGGEAGAPPPVWTPRETTMMRFLAAARRALPNGLDPKDEIETVAHALVVGLERLASQPSIEDDPISMDAAVDAVAGAARHPPSSREQAA